MNTSPTEPDQRKTRMRIAALFLLAHSIIVTWVFWRLAYAWPHAGSWLYLVLFLFVPGVVHQACVLFQRWKMPARFVRPLLTRLVSVPFGVALAVWLSNYAGALSLQGFERAYAPFVAELHDNLAAPCEPAARYFENATVAAYNLRTAPTRGPRAQAKLSYAPDRFVVALAGRSLDIDGSTIYYDSTNRQWRKFHNDNATEQTRYAARIEGLPECVLQAP